LRKVYKTLFEYEKNTQSHVELWVHDMEYHEHKDGCPTVKFLLSTLHQRLSSIVEKCFDFESPLYWIYKQWIGNDVEFDFKSGVLSTPCIKKQLKLFHRAVVPEGGNSALLLKNRSSSFLLCIYMCPGYEFETHFFGSDEQVREMKDLIDSSNAHHLRAMESTLFEE